jgi:hypothetical protein
LLARRVGLIGKNVVDLQITADPADGQLGLHPRQDSADRRLLGV